MQYLWDRDTLMSLFKQRSDEVQEWAAERLLRLYPEVEDDLLPLLPQATPMLAALILNHAQGYVNTAALQTFFTHAPQPLLKAKAAALLLRAGQTLPEAALAAVDMRHVLSYLAGTQPGFEVLLRRYQEAAATDTPLLHALALACGAAEIFMLLDEARDKKTWREALESLGTAWRCDVSELCRVSRAPAALSILEHTLVTLPLPQTMHTPWQQELLTALAQDRARLHTMAEVASARLSQRREATPSDVAFLVACILAVRRDAYCQTPLDKAQEVGQLWQAVVMRPWRAEVGPALVDWLRSLPPADVITSLLTALGHDYTYADYALKVLNAVGCPERFGLLIALSQHRESELICNEAVKALRASGAAAAAALVGHYRHHLPEPIDLLVLAEVPTLEVEEFLVTHFDHYMRYERSILFVEVLEMVASRRFLEPLLAEWREGELAIGQVITLIAAIHGVQSQRLRTIARDVETRSQRFKGLRQRIGEEPTAVFQDMMTDGAPLILPLRCTACGKTYHYEVSKVFMDPNNAEDIALWQIIQCKGCDGIETYGWTREARQPVMAEMMRLVFLMQTQKAQSKGKKHPPLPDTALVLQKPVIMVAMRRFQTMGEAYRFLLGELAKDPSKGDLHRHLGNLLKNGARPDLALPYYRQAIVLDPADAESYYNLVEILMEQKHYEEAVPLANTLVQLCREAPMDEALRREIFGAMLIQVSTLEKHTEQRIEIFPTAAPGMPRPEAGQEQPVVYLTSFNLDDPQDFERVYQTFRTGQAPQEMPRQGVPRSFREAFFSGDAGEDAVLETPALAASPVRTLQPKVGRNAPCPCGSGRKYKKCCGQ